METVERIVSELGCDERRVYESVLGHKLLDCQRVIIRVTDPVSPDSQLQSPISSTNIDDWAIFKDLSDEEIAELDAVILDRSPGREIDI